MADKLVKALKSFYHGKEVKTRRSAPFSVSEQQFRQLSAKGLVAEVVQSEQVPSPKSESKQQSALPADQASQNQTVKQLETGDKKPARRGRQAKNV